MKTFLSLFFTLTLVSAVNAQSLFEWWGIPVITTPGLDIVRGITVGNEGDVLEVTSDGGTKSGDDMVHVIRNRKTNELIRTRYNGPGNGDDRALAVFVGEDGNGVAVGNSQGNGTGVDGVIIKYDNAGNELWMSRFDSPVHGNDIIREAVMDARGNIIIAGVSHGTENGHDGFIAKYSPSGERQWATWPWNAALGEGASDVVALAVDDKGMIYLGGNHKTSSGQASFTAMIDRDGALGWATFPSWHNSLTDLAVDNSGNVITVGFSGAESVPGVTSLNNHGEEHWTRTLGKGFSDGSSSAPRSMRCLTDKLGNIFITGYVVPSACISTPCPVEIFSGMLDKRGNTEWMNSEERLTTAALVTNEVILGFMDYTDDVCMFGITEVHNDGEIFSAVIGVNHAGKTVFSSTIENRIATCFDAVSGKGKDKSFDMVVGGVDSKGDAFIASLNDVGPFAAKKTGFGNAAGGQAIALEPNTPNPFVTETVIAFTLPLETHVRLSVYDALGREVAVLADQTIGGGHHTRSFDASHLAAGMYKVRMVAAGQESVRTMVVSGK